MKGLIECIGQLNQAAYADTEIKLDAVTEPERLQQIPDPLMEIRG
jgi:hypothetical protein